MSPALGARLALLAAAAPLVLGAVLVRPADAQTAPAYASFSLSALAGGVRTGGVVGASGGLATLDTASASVSARLDSSPSAAVLAAPYEPGTLFRTGVGQVNAGAGQQVLDVPDAEAQFPGTPAEAELETVPPAEGGPARSQGGSATAAVTETSARGTATGDELVVTGAVEVGASTSEVALSAGAAKGTTTATGRTTVSEVVVAGVLVLEDVEATASITAKGDAHEAKARLVVGGASVAGQPVELSDEGVTAVGTPLLPGSTLQDATAQANAVLAGAGIEVRTLGTVEQGDARSATADTGGVAVTLTTAVAPGGVGGDRFDVVLGGVVLTAVDALAVPEVEVPVTVAPPVDAPAVSAPTTTFVPGTPGTPALPGTPAAVDEAPVVAQPVAAPAAFTVAGRRLSGELALAAFAVWQFLSLGTATLYAVVERRRRTALEALA